MNPKIARRFLSRNHQKLIMHVVNGTGKAMLKRARLAAKIIEKDARERI